jgi:phage terminase large subunit-like protein
MYIIKLKKLLKSNNFNTNDIPQEFYDLNKTKKLIKYIEKNGLVNYSFYEIYTKKLSNQLATLSSNNFNTTKKDIKP